ncbi:O-antigen translocase [Frateuria sp. STR12]|uniref:O-antigen translocase n=1 Tax=Frateuria hangzhouensis TaxID=2995589 RepID=UPI00226085DE|nr:O-antigen translocase [Frateuria sp. STR12]MCX7513739.1 O-antigen translocase [Frateuria sp. STR12]
MMSTTPYRTLIRSASVMGGASAISIIVAIVVSKGLSLLTGPYGVGLAGLYASLVAAFSNVANISGGGVRFIAEAKANRDRATAAEIVAALRSASWLLGLTAGTATWCLRGQLALWIFDDPNQSAAIGWLSLAVLLAILAASRSAQLNGLGQINDLAKITIAGSVISGATLLIFARIWGLTGVVSGVLSLQTTAFAISSILANRSGLRATSVPFRVSLQRAWPIMRLGLAFSASITLANVSQLVVRSAINHRLGPEAVGHFQAAWSISMTYIGFILAAMAVDYYPRLTATIADPQTTARLLNQQTTLAFVAACPIFLALFALAPWTIKLLYTSDFLPSVAILRWQILGDVFKLAAWPLGFVLLAANRPRAYLLAEVAWNVIYVAITLGLLDRFGLDATGIGFAISYILYLAMVYRLVRTHILTLWNRANRLAVTCVSLLIIALFIVNHSYPAAALSTGITITGLGSLISSWSIYHMLRQRKREMP